MNNKVKIYKVDKIDGYKVEVEGYAPLWLICRKNFDTGKYSFDPVHVIEFNNGHFCIEEHSCTPTYYISDDDNIKNALQGLRDKIAKNSEKTH